MRRREQKEHLQKGGRWMTRQLVTDDKYYNEHAALLGHVTLAWNDCHFEVLSIFHILSGLSWSKAHAMFPRLNLITIGARSRLLS
jgi:hypothetical protein